MQPHQRQLHHIVQAQAGQGFQLRTAPGHALGHKALRGRQHRIGLRLAAHAPQQAFQPQARAAAAWAGRVAAVFGEQHANVHLVGLALQIRKKAADAVPGLLPLAVPARRAVQHPIALRGRELAPGNVARNALGLGVAQQVVLDFFPRGCLDGFDGAGAQRQLVVGHDQIPIHPNHPAKAPALGAGPCRRVKGKQRGQRRLVADGALGAMQAQGKFPDFRFRGISQRIHLHQPLAAQQRQLNRFHGAGAFDIAHAKAVGHHVQHFHAGRFGGFFAFFGRRGGFFQRALGLNLGKAAGQQPLLHLVGAGAGGQLHGKGDDQARIACGLGALLQLGINAVCRVVAHRLGGLPVKQRPGAGKQELEVVVQLRHRAHGGAGIAHRVGLVDGNRWRHPLHLVHGGLVHAIEKLPRIGAEGFHIAPLPLGIQGVEHQTGFARATGAGDHRQLPGADVHIQILQIVLARAVDADKTVGGIRGRR